MLTYQAWHLTWYEITSFTKCIHSTVQVHIHLLEIEWNVIKLNAVDDMKMVHLLSALWEQQQQQQQNR